MKVSEAVRLLLREEGDNELSVLVHGIPGFQRVQRICTYKEDGIVQTVFLVNEPPAIAEVEPCTNPLR